MANGHLILSRKQNETVVLTLEDGREIEVKVVMIRGNKIKLGFACDCGIGITRGESLGLVAAGKERGE